MSTASPALPRPTILRGRLGRLATPDLLRLALALALGGIVIFGVAIALSVRSLQDGARVIRFGAAPGIETARELRAVLADMEANAATDILAGAAGAPAARASFDDRRRAASSLLVVAAEGLSFEAERVPLRRLNDQLGYYGAQVTRAQALMRLGRADEATARFSEASRLMHEVIVPAADDLATVNVQAYRDDERRQARLLAATRTLAAAGAGLLVAFLVGLSIWLAVRSHRLINPPLVLAIVGLVAATVLFAVRLNAYEHAFRRGLGDGLEPVIALWEARALAFDANGDASLSLLFTGEQDFYEARARRTMSAVLERPIAPDVAVQMEDQGAAPRGLTGAIGAAATSSAAEQSLLFSLLRAHARYLEIDAQARLLEHAGRHPEAVALTTGIGLGDLNWAFDRLDDGLVQLLAANRTEFERESGDALASLDLALPIVPIGALLAAGLAWLGLGLRLRDYTHL